MMSALSLKAIFISSSETSNSRYPVSGPVTAAQWQQQQRQEAVDHSTDLSKMLAASAPVLEMRQCVQLGLQQYVLRWVNNKKIKPGADIVFSNAMKSRRWLKFTQNRVTSYVVNNEINAVTDKHSWIVIDEELSLKKVKRSTIGKVDTSSIQCDFTDLECHEKTTLE